jgi:beta-glucanase (GH16 family)
MTMHLNRDSSGTWVAAPVPKLPNAVGRNGGQQYGTYSITWKADQATPGFKLAWLQWPDSENWPGDGEIDFPEGSLTGSISAFMHREGGTSGSDQDAYSTGVPVAGAWHTTILDWQADHCDFYLDGKLVGHSTSRIPNTPMHQVIQSETDLNGTTPAVGASADIHISNYSYWQPGAWSPSAIGTTP